MRRYLRPAVPLLRRARIERPVRAAYEGIHGYRHHVGTLLVVAADDDRAAGLADRRDLGLGRAVGIELSIRPYFVLCPLLFLVMLVPFTINGLAVREAFFVSFLGRLGVSADDAFATGFIFFLMTIILALPGLAIILWEGFRSPAVSARMSDDGSTSRSSS